MAIYVNGKLVAGSGLAGLGVPGGGTTGQVLVKKTALDYDTQWIDLPESNVLDEDIVASDAEVTEMLNEVFKASLVNK